MELFRLAKKKFEYVQKAAKQEVLLVVISLGALFVAVAKGIELLVGSRILIFSYDGGKVLGYCFLFISAQT